MLVGKLRDLKSKRPSNAEMSHPNKDQEEEENQRLELADERDLYFDGERYNEEVEKPMDEDEESGGDAEYDMVDASIDMNDE